MALVELMFEHATDQTVVSISLFVALLCVCIVIGHLLQENRWVNESITAIIIVRLVMPNKSVQVMKKSVGLITGTIILLLSKGESSHILRFNEELFFIYLLPPIIFNAGFQVKKKQFFHNSPTIVLFGVLGVFISFIIISAGSWWLLPKIGLNGLDVREYLALGVIFSSTDTVCTLQVLNQDETPRLYSLVFGEGVVNDATSVVLFNAIQKIDVSKLHGQTVLDFLVDFLYLLSASTLLGIATGLLTAYALKKLYFGRHSTDREIAVMILMAYLSYILAELSRLSGILTVFFCGIIMSHYAWHNVTENSRITTRHIFATLSFIAETFIFLYVGMDALDIQKWKTTRTSLKTSLAVDCIIICLVLLGRAAFVFPLSVLSNYLSSNADRTLITFKHQFVIWWAGLMRGAVSIALAFSQFTFGGVTWDPVHATVITSTIVVVLFSTLVFGFLTSPLVRIVLPPPAPENLQTEEEIILPLLYMEDSTAENLPHARSLTMLLERPTHTIHAYWRKFDDTYMRPVFGGPSSPI